MCSTQQIHWIVLFIKPPKTSFKNVEAKANKEKQTLTLYPNIFSNHTFDLIVGYVINI